MRQETLDHVLPGLGRGLRKLRLLIVCQWNGSGAADDIRACDWKAWWFGCYINGAGTGRCIVIDEIHRLHRSIEEVLSCNGRLLPGHWRWQSPSARSVRSTFRLLRWWEPRRGSGAFDGSFGNRFGVMSRLEYYTQEELADIVWEPLVFEVEIDKPSALEIARDQRDARVAEPPAEKGAWFRPSAGWQQDHWRHFSECAGAASGWPPRFVILIISCWWAWSAKNSTAAQ